MPGKWSGLKGTVPTAPIDSDFQSRVNAAKSAVRYVTTDGEFTEIELTELNRVISPNTVEREFTFDQLSQQELGKRYTELRDKKDALEAQEKKINLELEAVQQLLIPKMEQNGMDLYRMPSGDSLSIKDEPYCSVADKDAFTSWIKETGQESLLTVHYMTLSAMTKDRLQTGQNPPPGIKVFLKQSITRRRARA
jgi:hypothetical protein